MTLWIKKIAYIFTFITMFYLQIFCQLSQGGIPLSLQHNLKSSYLIPTFNLKKVDIKKSIAYDSLNYTPNRFAEVEEVQIDIKKLGQQFILPDGKKIWLYKVQCENAYALGIGFKYFHIPDNSSLYIYNFINNKILGAYTSNNNKDDSTFYVEPIIGNEAIIEYYEPEVSTFSGLLVIDKISKAYKNLESIALYNDITCNEWQLYQTVKQSVCRIIFTDVDGSYYCSGSLINNTRFDGTPYFLTANHCINNSAAAASVIVYFNYQSDTCNGNVINYQTLSGASLIANSSNTDFSLLLLKENPPAWYRPYFAGWDIRGIAPNKSAVIHHPKGLKKSIAISTLKGNIYPYGINWDDGSFSQPRTHWEITFTNGTTDNGSSGSPLFNENLRIIGQLHGGDNTTNYYGALSVSWKNGNLANQRLQPWLDPDNTGVTYIDGSTGREIPIANFTTIPEKPCTNAPVYIIDSTKNTVKERVWRIYPSSFVFLPDSNGNITDSTSKNPVIQFLSNDRYLIQLIAKNNFGSDTITKEIQAGNIENKFLITKNNYCGYEFKNVLFETSDKYHVQFIFDTSRFYYIQHENKLWLTLNNNPENDSSFTTKIISVASHGNCIVEDSLAVTINIPWNDMIRNALPLKYGLNGPFTNECASIEEDEPRPITGGCTVKDNWCYDDGNPLIGINNTLWFYFFSPADNVVNIETKGYDTRIAIYEAKSSEDILNNKYKLIAANDNSIDSYEASLNNIMVEKDKKYWLQVDGYKKATGNLLINFYTNSLQLYPNPANNHVNIIFPVKEPQSGILKIISTTGNLLYEVKITVSESSNTFNIDLNNIPNGIYLVQFQNSKIFYSKKLIIVKNK